MVGRAMFRPLPRSYARHCTTARGARSPLHHLLKRALGAADAHAVPTRELDCPVCNAHVPLAGDERPGDEVHCTYCGAPCVLRRAGPDPDELELEEDF